MRGLTGGADLQAEPNRSPSKIEDKKKADLWRKAGRKVGGDEGWGVDADAGVRLYPRETVKSPH